MTTKNRLALAREALFIEADAVRALASRLGEAFLAACEAILKTSGRLVVTGMGKSGHVGRKLAATFASTGTPAFFVHPGEAAHGDLGMILSEDCVLALSYSGESEEVLALLPSLKRKGCTLIALTGRPQSALAQEADIHLDSSVEKEACRSALAPTASTTVAMALGDALAVALLDARGFTPEDFASSHPGGRLGRRLLIHVRDLMRTGTALPYVAPTTSLHDVLFEITEKGMGMVAVVDAEHHLLGIFTDGDLRRALNHRVDLFETPVQELMVRNPHTIGEHELAVTAVQKMETHRINGLMVISSDQRLVGALNMHDLFRAGVV